MKAPAFSRSLTECYVAVGRDWVCRAVRDETHHGFLNASCPLLCGRVGCPLRTPISVSLEFRRPVVGVVLAICDAAYVSWAWARRFTSSMRPPVRDTRFPSLGLRRSRVLLIEWTRTRSMTFYVHIV